MTNEETKLVTKKLQPDETLLSWQAPEFIDHDRNHQWYIAAVVVILGILAYSVYTRDWFFIGVLMVMVAVSFKYLNQKPSINLYAISRIGIFVNDRLYSFDDLHSFWIVYQPPVKTLNIMSVRKYMPALTIQLDDQDPVIIRSILKKFIPEQEKRGESFADKLSRVLKF